MTQSICLGQQRPQYRPNVANVQVTNVHGTNGPRATNAQVTNLRPGSSVTNAKVSNSKVTHLFAGGQHDTKTQVNYTEVIHYRPDGTWYKTWRKQWKTDWQWTHKNPPPNHRLNQAAAIPHSGVTNTQVVNLKPIGGSSSGGAACNWNPKGQVNNGQVTNCRPGTHAQNVQVTNHHVVVNRVNRGK